DHEILPARSDVDGAVLDLDLHAVVEAARTFGEADGRRDARAVLGGQVLVRRPPGHGAAGGTPGDADEIAGAPVAVKRELGRAAASQGHRPDVGAAPAVPVDAAGLAGVARGEVDVAEQDGRDLGGRQGDADQGGDVGGTGRAAAELVLLGVEQREPLAVGG